MAEKRKRITERDVTGLKYFRRLLPLFKRLHKVGCERDKAGNRRLHMDQYCALVLLFLFNPCLRSLRALQQASELKNVQKKLGYPRASLGSLSEATDTLSTAARKANVLGDEIVELGLSKKRPDHPVRLVCVRVAPHVKRGGRKGGSSGPPSDGVLRIATNLLDPPAEVIAEIYLQRWTIELFFRFFKHILGCRHLLSQDRVGIEIQTYCAIIACLLISLTTGCKPTLRTYEMICLYLQGWADEEELLAHLAKLKPHAN